MSAVFLLLILILLIMIGCMGYFAYQIYKDHKEDIHDIKECRKHYHKKDALAIDYFRLEGALKKDDHRWWMTGEKKWIHKGDNIDEPYEWLYRQGYLKADKWMTKLRYYGIPVFVKLHGFEIIDPRTMDEERIGAPRNQLTSTIMHNTYKARTVKKWKDALSKVSFAEMDMKGLGLIIPIIIGLVIGVAYFMLGGF